MTETKPSVGSKKWILGLVTAIVLAALAYLGQGCAALGLESPPPVVAQAAPAVVDTACALGLVQSAAAVVSAELGGVPVEWLADRLCSDPELVAAFLRARKDRAVDPGRGVIGLARSRGLCK